MIYYKYLLWIRSHANREVCHTTWSTSVRMAKRTNRDSSRAYHTRQMDHPACQSWERWLHHATSGTLWTQTRSLPKTRACCPCFWVMSGNGFIIEADGNFSITTAPFQLYGVLIQQLKTIWFESQEGNRPLSNPGRNRKWCYKWYQLPTSGSSWG